MDNLVVILLVVITLILLMGVFWLFLEYKKLRKQHDVLLQYVERVNKDVAGLCSAALLVDNKLIDNDEQLKKMVEKVTDFEFHEQQTAQPYHSAIQQVRQGADAETLIHNCGLTREEALLLIRLHGNG